MRELVILSGKGGTGKTSIAASFGLLAAGTAVLADCDVDASNLHLLMKPKVMSAEAFFSGELAHINPESCIGCGKCEEVCHFNAVSHQEETYLINSLSCEGCGYCAVICPTQAIEMNPARSGDLFVSEIKSGDMMAHARLFPGADNSGKLVARVKMEAKKLAKKYQRELIIIDGAPGIGCPVVSSLSGADYVILVTEPSASGLHDLMRLVEVLKKFRLKAGCIINKADLHPDKAIEIEDFCKAYEIDILGKLPYDKAFTEAMIQGKTIIETNKSIRILLEEIWNNINLKSI
jgi:MinD superfamily P-loop ATPase